MTPSPNAPPGTAPFMKPLFLEPWDQVYIAQNRANKEGRLLTGSAFSHLNGSDAAGPEVTLQDKADVSAPPSLWGQEPTTTGHSHKSHKCILWGYEPKGSLTRNHKHKHIWKNTFQVNKWSAHKVQSTHEDSDGKAIQSALYCTALWKVMQ